MYKLFDRLADLLLFREGTEVNEYGKTQPVVTVGSIVWGVMLRAAIVVFLSFLVVQFFHFYGYWWSVLFIFWFAAVYPGWKQYQTYQVNIKKIQDSTLCGTCVHFDASGQLCKMYDEHVSSDYIPCEGLNWEPKSFEDN